MGGGPSAAYGFLYQYLVTADYFLSFLTADGVDAAEVALLIEPTDPTAATSIGADPDIVDFAIEHRGEIVERVQVKGSRDPSANKLHPGEAADVMGRFQALGGVHHLLTNRPLSAGLADTCTRVKDDESPFGQFAYPAADLDTLSSGQFILVDRRSVDDLAASVAGHVRSARADRMLSQGEPTSRIVSMVLLHHIFRSAAGTGAERSTAVEIVALLKTPDHAVAHVLGSFDWGVPIGGIPTFSSTVPRVAQLDEIFAALQRDGNGRQPRMAILTAATGYGKSALAANFCHLHYNAFEFMCWIDCREHDTMMTAARRYAEQLTNTRLGHKTDPTSILHDALARHRGRWLLVFDGATSRKAIESLIPKNTGTAKSSSPRRTRRRGGLRCPRFPFRPSAWTRPPPVSPPTLVWTRPPSIRGYGM
ncbi:hypothetical protein QN239_31865 [Mycolicibacterium sp. Y3]